MRERRHADIEGVKRHLVEHRPVRGEAARPPAARAARRSARAGLRIGERRDLDIVDRRQHMEMPLGDAACADEADPGHADPVVRLPCRSASTIL